MNKKFKTQVECANCKKSWLWGLADEVHDKKQKFVCPDCRNLLKGDHDCGTTQGEACQGCVTIQNIKNIIEQNNDNKGN